MTDETQIAEAKDTNNEFQTIINTIPTPVMTIDPDFNVTFLNRAGEKVVGLGEGEAVGKKCYDLFKTPHCRTSECRCAQAMQSKQACTGDTYADPTGLNLPIRYTGSPLTNSRGEVTGAVEYVLDISSEFKIADTVENLAEKVVVGELDQRADLTGFEGSYKNLLESVNKVVDAFEEPISDLVPVLTQMSEGDLTVRLTKEYHGEYDRLKQATNTMGESVQRAISEITQNATSLSSASEELSAVSNQMASAAEETSNQASTVSAAAEQVTQNMQSVSSATEEMNSSIKEISKNASEAASVAKKAVSAADSSKSSMEELNTSSQEIGQVIKLITSVAQQTNLLALNATIEAARAGEAGKGFAVVANEVKELAKQTAEATEEISQKIEAIQSRTGMASESIAEVSDVIQQIDNIQQTIAAAVEEQTSTTTEIARNINEAAKGGSEIGSSMTNMTQAANDASQGAQNTLQSSQSLSEMASTLSNLVSKFKA
jgi:methyl-accepting chemotaxis protein